ncbi:8-amino-7-oxononanoate synthase [Catenovulum maritimum]|uniref:8-amino-7-ketopelargonate synthase n=1 Tax=Catenovulum maritimum TaxID=1513271 RepID=A0A0J8GQA3_9ALTE|nr:8-amino-7-oxononanoate synthase [Catenovulum maritimum]KMT64922.1 hypothetical protein XM47_11985 [Catenovulum maritimum]
MLPQSLKAALETKSQASAYRRRYSCSTQDQYIQVAGKTYLNFSGNDYLGLANSDELKQAWQQASDTYSAGSTGSALINGYHIAHQKAEEKIADWLGFESCLLFSTGFSANSSILKSLMTNAADYIIQDKLNHASLIDGGIAANAKNIRFQHNDIQQLNNKLDQAGDNYKLVVTEGVFSMDGDSAPLAEIKQLLSQHNNTGLMIDDAHGLGVFGAQGQGSAYQQGLNANDIDIFTATFGKAFGLSGAFVGGSQDLVEYLVNHARSYIYSTSMSPIQAGVIASAVDIVKNASWRREKLAANIQHYHKMLLQLGLADDEANLSNSAIQPFIIGSNQAALELSARLREMGFWVTAIRPPTVPKGTARLRITLSASQTTQNISQLVEAIAQVKQQIHEAEALAVSEENLTDKSLAEKPKCS